MIGDLSRRITLQRPDRTADGGGGFETTWTSVGAAWASVRSSAGTEQDEGDDLVRRVGHQLRLRWRDDVVPGWRVVLEGRVLRVRSAVDRNGRKRWLDLECEEEIR